MTDAGGSDPIRVLVADDHPMFRAGVVASLRELPDVTVIAEASDGSGALRMARETLPDVALLDITMPGNGLKAARDITAACPATRVVMLTVSEDEDDLLAAMKAGASGYVLKGASAAELARVLHADARERSTSHPDLPGACCARCRSPGPRRSTS